MSRVLILHTGGTIGMTKTEKGYQPDGEYFRRAVFHMDSLKAAGMPEWDFMETDPLLDSSRMAVSEWNMIGQLIADHYEAYDGFVFHAQRSREAGDPDRLTDTAVRNPQ